MYELRLPPRRGETEGMVIGYRARGESPEGTRLEVDVNGPSFSKAKIKLSQALRLVEEDRSKSGEIVLNYTRRPIQSRHQDKGSSAFRDFRISQGSF